MDTTQRKRLALLGYADRRKIAADAEVDVRTLDRAIAGQPLKTMTQERIDRALDRLGHGKGEAASHKERR